MPVSPYILQQSVYKTRRSQNQGIFLIVPRFHSSSHKSAKHFGHSFVFDAPTLWNSLPVDVCGSSTLCSFWIKLKAFFHFFQGISTISLILLVVFMVSTSNHPWISVVFYGFVSCDLECVLLAEIKFK